MKHTISYILGLIFLTSFKIVFSQAIIINHNCSKLDPIPIDAIQDAKDSLHIAYGHTSHGSQLITGMTSLVGQSALIGYKGDVYDWNEGGTNGALDIDDYFGSGDLGHNGDTTWAALTRTYLANHSNVNVVIYSWCGGVSDNTSYGIQTYLDKMNELEQDYPNVKFVYMTGHTDIWNDATLKANNQQIRDYCIANNKVLYDFADIERYNPDDTYFEFVSDNCNYYDDGSGTTQLGNWATEWQNSHTEGVDWYDCSAAHTEPLNGNLKAYAAWWLWCRLAGWEDIVYIEEANNNSQFNVKIYPNPTTERFTIEGENIKSYIVINAEGKLIKEIKSYNKKTEIDLGEQPKGIYFIKVITEKGINVRKVVLE